MVRRGSWRYSESPHLEEGSLEALLGRWPELWILVEQLLGQVPELSCELIRDGKVLPTHDLEDLGDQGGVRP